MSTPEMRALAQDMTSVVVGFLDALDPAQRRSAQGALQPDEHTRWTYLPGARPGVRVGNLTTEQRRLASQLLATLHGQLGLSTAESVLTVEAYAQGLQPDPDGQALLTRHLDADYWVRVLGRPGSDAWAWRLSGHHLVAQATVIGTEVFSTPHFFGANPARVPRGPHAGLRGLAEEEDLARRLVHLFDLTQRERALSSPRAPADIESRDNPIAVPPQGAGGLVMAGMDVEQRQLFGALIGQYLGRVAAPVANRAWTDLRDAGLGSVAFRWAGGLQPGQGHYYAITSPSLLIEYDNTQNGANHIHSVWRDLRRDWGGDVLAQHYRRQHRRDSGPDRPEVGA